MVQISSAFAVLAVAVSSAVMVEAQSKPNFSVSNLPDKWEEGQIGTNQCKQYGASNPKSKCQNIFINSVSDFCLWAPQKQGTVGAQEEKMYSYCTRSGYGTRLIPDGTIKKAHFLKTPTFVQVTGFGDFTSMKIDAGDEGGELDPHGATGAGNPPGGLVFSRNFKGREGQWVQSKEWSSFMSATEFSFRACLSGTPGKDAKKLCPHIYDVMGAMWNHPGNYGDGFDDCEGENGGYPGVYTKKNGSVSTFYQGQAKTPGAHAPGASSNCVARASVKNRAATQTPYRRNAHARSAPTGVPEPDFD